MSTTVVTFKVPIELDQRLRHRAADLRTSRSEVLRRAAELFLEAKCPQCDHPTVEHPDAVMVGVRYCSKCQEAVSYEPKGENDV